MREAEILILTPVLKWVLISKLIACFEALHDRVAAWIRDVDPDGNSSG